MEELKYDIIRPWRSLDDWQKKYIDTEGNCALLTGRQVGKSTAMSIKAARRALKYPNRNILIIAFTERQAYEIFFKCLNYLQAEHAASIKGGRDKPTMHEINLRNGSCIMCYATGLTGEGIRGFTIHHLFVDEAKAIAREVFIAISPMLAVTGGTMDIASTPAGKQGYFWDIFDPTKEMGFNKFYVSGEDCPRYKKEFLESEKKRMSKMEYAQEYLAIFLDELQRLFPDELIKNVCILKRPNAINQKFKHYLGVDIARMGGDEITFEIIRKLDNETFEHVENIVDKMQLTTWTENKIIELEGMYKFQREGIGIDAGAGTLGVAVLDHLLKESKTMNKVVAINNRAISLDKNDKGKQKLMKIDLYMNLLSMLQSKKLKLLDDDEIKASLASVQYEFVIAQGRPTRMNIFGNYTHIAEGLIRAAWLAAQDKHLNLWAAY